VHRREQAHSYDRPIVKNIIIHHYKRSDITLALFCMETMNKPHCYSQARMAQRTLLRVETLL